MPVNPSFNELIIDAVNDESLTAALLYRYAEETTNLVNARAATSPRYTDLFALSVNQISALLSNTNPIGKQSTTLGISQLRILQTLSDIAQRDISAQDFWRERSFPQKQFSEQQVVSREAYETFLPVLDKKYNRHFQTFTHLDAAFGASTRGLFQRLHRAYNEDSYMSDRPLSPHPTLARMAEVLGCDPTEIVTRAHWEQALHLELKHREIVSAERPETARHWAAFRRAAASKLKS